MEQDLVAATALTKLDACATKAAAAAAAVMTNSTSKGASPCAAPAVGGPVSTGAVAGDPRLTSSFRAGGGSDAIGAGETAAAREAARAGQPRGAFRHLPKGSEGCGVSPTGSHAMGPPSGAGTSPHASAGARVKREKASKVDDDATGDATGDSAEDVAD